MTLKTLNILLGLVVAALAARELADRLTSPQAGTSTPPVVESTLPVATSPAPAAPVVEDDAPVSPDAAARARAGFESRAFCDPAVLAATMARDRWTRAMRDAAPMMAAVSCLDTPR